MSPENKGSSQRLQATTAVPREEAGAIEIEELAAIDALEALRPEWAQLWERSAAATPFQTPEWALAWWRCFGQGRLCVLALRRAGQLAGVAPLFIHSDSGSADPGSAARQVLLIGTGHSDYLDALLDDGIAFDGAAAIFDHLARISARWDVCDLQQLMPGSPLLTAASPAEWSSERAVQEFCPALSLSNGAEALPARMRAKLRYYRRRAEQLGTLRIEQATGENLEELFAALLRLHRARWTARGEAGILWDERLQSFHLEAATGLLQRGVLRLYAMRLDGSIIAAYYGFFCRRKAYYYLGGFDPAFEQLSTGTLLTGHAIEAAIDEGAEEFDFLRGQENYKYRWGALDRPTYQCRLRYTRTD